MDYLSKININGSVKHIKDLEARQSITNIDIRLTKVEGAVNAIYDYTKDGRNIVEVLAELVIKQINGDQEEY